jgi:hypothetical protein
VAKTVYSEPRFTHSQLLLLCPCAVCGVVVRSVHNNMVEGKPARGKVRRYIGWGRKEKVQKRHFGRKSSLNGFDLTFP